MDSASVEIFNTAYSSGVNMGIVVLRTVIIVSLVIMFGRLAERA